jgi:putative two-component system response regulator
MMPEIDGFEAMRRLKADTRYADIPVIFLTGRSDSATEALGFEMGAVDFVTKPFSAPVLRNRIKTHLDIENIIRERTENLKKLKNSIVSVLANMVENRDTITGGHIERTTRYVDILLRSMLKRGIYADEISKWDFEMAVSSVRLHDIGKIAISDVVLNKPDRLTQEEFELIKSHVFEGERIIEGIIKESGDEIFLHYAKLFAGYHHERWDGKGYSRGLSGTDIPLQGRIMAIADVYDALVSDRPYKKAFTHEEAVRIIIEGRDSQFEPIIVNAFLDVMDDFKGIAASIARKG